MKNTRVKVAIWMRPMLDSEIKRGEKVSDRITPDYQGNKCVKILVDNERTGIKKDYLFDTVLDEGK